MKIVASYSDDCADESCPTVHLTDDGRVLVQGGAVSASDKKDLNVPGHEDVVIFDRSVFENITRKFLA